MDYFILDDRFHVSISGASWVYAYHGSILNILTLLKIKQNFNDMYGIKTNLQTDLQTDLQTQIDTLEQIIKIELIKQIKQSF